MANDLMKNLGEVKEEARSMLTTLEAVKGPHYASTVRSLLLIKQVAMIGSLLCEESQRVNPPIASACAKGLSDSLCVIASSLQNIGQITDQEWSEITKDAMAMGDSVDGLIRTAVDTSNTGSGFGG